MVKQNMISTARKYITSVQRCSDPELRYDTFAKRAVSWKQFVRSMTGNCVPSSRANGSHFLPSETEDHAYHIAVELNKLRFPTESWNQAFEKRTEDRKRAENKKEKRTNEQEKCARKECTDCDKSRRFRNRVRPATRLLLPAPCYRQ